MTEKTEAVVRTDSPGEDAHGTSRRRFITSSAAVVGGGLLAGAAGGAPTALASTLRRGKAVKGLASQGIVAWDTAVEATNLNPIGGTNNAAVTNVRCWVTNTLLRPGAKATAFTPDLAVAVPSPAKGSKGLVYNVKVRSGVRFSNGAKFSAKDVATTYQTVMNPANGSIWAGSVIGVKSVEAVDASTVRFQMSSAVNPFVVHNMMASIPIVSAAQATDKTTLATAPIGTGAFMVSKVVPGNVVHLKPNPHYFRKGLPKVKGIDYLVVPDDTTRVVNVRNGLCALTADVPYEQISVLEGHIPKLFAVKTAPTRFYYYTNALKPGLSDVNLRQAMAYAIDRQAIIDTVFGGKGRIGGSAWSANTAYFDPKVNNGHYSRRPNLTKAKAYLAKAQNVPSSISMSLIAGDTVVTDAFTILQANWQALGLNVVADTESLAGTVGKLFSKPLGNPGSYDMFIYLDILGTGPGYGFSYITGTYLIGGNVNLWNITDASLQRDIATLVNGTSRAEIQKAATAIQQFQLDNLFETCICYPDYLEAEGVPLTGYRPAAIGGLPYTVENASIA